MQPSESTSHKRLAMGIVEYLDKAVADGLVAGDGAESLEIAKQCIADAFGLDVEDAAQVKELSLKPLSLDKVFDVYTATQAKLGGAKEAPEPAGPSDEDRRRADAFKAEGNNLVIEKEYAGAIDAYTRAIALVGDNAVFYGNRAAAYSQTGEHQKAVDDAKKALEIDPAYSKGYSRLGLAYFGLGSYKEAADAYEKGLELDPANPSMLKSLEHARAKIAESPEGAAAARDVPSAGSSGGAGGLGGGLGGLDLGSLMNNPALMGMAQNMMANGGLERLMSNPAVSQMMNNFRSTGQMPNMSDMLSNPDLMNMAKQFMGGSGGPPPPPSSSSS
ncbi:Small glutamine-rich tetratricopeptide repeat-containing protein 2 [Coemansia javaensis]|uniref:Small glutamine-rich tetratricopeptide repeat-containing protein 2 n=1 Tax=Coemansia javaensis TaxID=2761396 RepID=A0A9W8H8U4_9FUNG|nr:Small glutamine-rich tetratricopeptide repeat-containing protein 2 [Coemansia javaensis]